MAVGEGSKKEPVVKKEPSASSVFTGESSSAGAATRVNTAVLRGV
jgi:hypothetical protein